MNMRSATQIISCRVDPTNVQRIEALVKKGLAQDRSDFIKAAVEEHISKLEAATA